MDRATIQMRGKTTSGLPSSKVVVPEVLEAGSVVVEERLQIGLFLTRVVEKQLRVDEEYSHV